MRQIVYLLYQHNKIINQVRVIIGVHIKDNKLVTITELKSSHFHLPKDVDNNLKHEIDCIIKYDEFLAEHRITNKSANLFLIVEEIRLTNFE